MCECIIKFRTLEDILNLDGLLKFLEHSRVYWILRVYWKFREHIEGILKFEKLDGILNLEGLLKFEFLKLLFPNRFRAHCACFKNAFSIAFPFKKQQTTLKIFRRFAPDLPTPTYTRSGLSVSHALREIGEIPIFPDTPQLLEALSPSSGGVRRSYGYQVVTTWAILSIGTVFMIAGSKTKKWEDVLVKNGNFKQLFFIPDNILYS